MYTEDDEKVSLKEEDNSDNNYNDFYTSFNDLNDDKNDKKKKKKKENKEEIPEKTEADYSSFYGNEEESDEKPSNKGNIIKIAIVSVLLIAVIVLLIILISGSKEKGDIELLKNDITLNIGESSIVSYSIIDTQKEVTSDFISSNPLIATVDKNGKVTAISPGTTTIVVHYTIGDKTRSKECKVTVNEDPNISKDISLKLTNFKDNGWTNKDVDINVSATSVYGIETLKYAINCDNDCNYQDISNNKIKVTSIGTTKVTVVATDKNNQKATKTVTIKIDKDNPTAKLIGESNVKGRNSVKVCAECSDSLSGCKQSQFCKIFTSSKTNQTITVEDNAGNTSKSGSFNVTITKIEDPCSLSVSSSGLVTATLREEANYYGFNPSYSGAKEKSKQINIDLNKKGSLGQVVNYYVLNKNGSGGMCYILVIKECNCTDKTRTDASCPVTCTYYGKEVTKE